MATDDKLTRVELLQADDESRYLLRDPLEIVHLIRMLAAERALVTAYLAPGSQSLLTMVLGLTSGEDAVLLDGSTSEAINRQVELAERITCITHLDKVRVQFSLGTPSRQTTGNGAVFSTALPTEVLRLQRRDFFRLNTPVAQTVLCSIPLDTRHGIGRRGEMRILDISTGGIAVAVPPSGLALVPGMSFDGCQLKLPASEPISAQLTVRNVFRLVTRNGTEMLRAGCQFTGLPPQAEGMIQRYIMKNEKQRSALARSRH